MKILNEIAKKQSVAHQLDHLKLERHEFVKGSLRNKQTSLAEIGRELGVKSSTMTMVSKGQATSERIQLKLAEILELDPAVLWPERFNKMGDIQCTSTL